jgi:ATP-binding cassette subfamily F protein 3
MSQRSVSFRPIDDIATGDIRTRIRDDVRGFPFQGEEEIEKKGKGAFGRRTVKAGTYIGCCWSPTTSSFLIEPTNHLDMRS